MGSVRFCREILSALGSHPALRKLCVVGSTTAMMNATGSVLQCTTSLQCLELFFILDKESLRVMLEALRMNHTVY
jgi:hypothetical protein